ncbi:F-box associated domain-containing protein [Caenorhabditis elegans]|uniref:F-box associated domain-containing protein n=1 Tax=Caenorhabditis elegans TaxID=6239 RepID=O45427_CAEEL|nr:F-box domain-containing protein [Caenorhabditis elegans]CAB07200.1 F-box domain-containing protein [Caenorhabditis elegans]|eukprot:NP_507386.1 SKN-1 Dependent Zygotic transcript [Caenorhabditis elegans]
MSAFRVADLSFLPLKNVLRQMSIGELINFSVDSPKLQQFIKSMKIPTGGFSVFLGAHDRMIKSDQQPWGYSFNKSTIEDDLTFFHHGLKHLENLFKVSLNTLSFGSSYMAYKFLEQEEKMPRSCEYLIINEISTGLDEFWQHQKDELVESISVEKGIVLSGEAWSNSDKIYNVDYLFVGHSGNMALTDLLQFNNRIVFLDRVSTSNQTIRNFLQVLKKSNSQLEVLTIRDSWEGSWDPIEVLEGLNAQEWNPEHRPQKFFLNSSHSKNLLKIQQHFYPKQKDSLANGIDLAEAYDFLRDDGVRVSVLFGEAKLQVFVWSQREKKLERKRRRSRGLSEPAAKRSC